MATAISEELYLDERKIQIKDLAEKQKEIITNGSAVKTGRKISGRDEYVKHFFISSLPNNSALNLGTGLDHSKIRFLSVVGMANGDAQALPLPFVSLSGWGIQVVPQYLTNTIIITTPNDRSLYSAHLDVYFFYV